jgi:uncharacterized protein YbaR (Trm112 family)
VYTSPSGSSGPLANDGPAATEDAMAVDDWLLEVLRCPDCGARVHRSERSGVTCVSCHRDYPEQDGILVMLAGEEPAGEER